MQTAGGCTSRALHLTSMPSSCLHGPGWLQPADTQQAVSCTGGAAAACQSTFIHSRCNSRAVSSACTHGGGWHEPGRWLVHRGWILGSRSLTQVSAQGDTSGLQASGLFAGLYRLMLFDKRGV